MKTVACTISLVATMALGSAPAAADKLGEHPAVVAKRLHAAQGYDYASKFYPHPAWLYLLPAAPPAMPVDQPAASVAGRQQAPQALEKVADSRR